MERFLSRSEASAAVDAQGWRFVLGTLRTAVPVGSLAEAVTVAARAVEACGPAADEHLRLDLRPRHVSLTLRPQAFGGVTARDAELAHLITEALHALGLTTTPGRPAPPPPSDTSAPLAPRAQLTPSAQSAPPAVWAPSAQSDPPAVSARFAQSDPPAVSARFAQSDPPPQLVPSPVSASPAQSVSPAVSSPPAPAPSSRDVGRDWTGRSVQEWEIAIDAMDIASIRPFWKAVLGYADEPGKHGPEDRLVDPLRQGPAVWFQQMSEPRPQRNRIHFDVSVPHDEAPGRVATALAAGGHLVSGERAPSFWVLADREDNEVCVTTWQGRDI
ncbi:VOC family protein [Actinoplanes sp. CA-252034]|uniref:VOC family protein n=1 Tax=Actinoplanes sp. CA-252034 TaxID=3239906 RepID=UPI003D99DD83